MRGVDAVPVLAEQMKTRLRRYLHVIDVRAPAV